MLAVQNSVVARKKKLSASAKLLLENLNGVASGFRSVAIAVVADAGMGKTHTVQQVIEVLPCTRVSIHAAEPLRWLHSRLPATPKSLPLWAQQVLKQIKDQQVVPEKFLAQALCSYFTALAPVVLHLEDVHEASAEQLALWIQIAQMLGKSKGVALIATSRLPLPAVFQEISLRPLEFDAAQDVLQAATEYPLPIEAVNWIYGRSLGNPLYALEFFGHFTENGALWSDGHEWFWREPNNDVLPRSLEDLIVTRLENVVNQTSDSQLLRQVLIELALLPPEVFQLNQHQEHLAAIGLLERARVWQNETFVHPLYKEVLREKLWSTTREQIARDKLDLVINTAPESAGIVVKAANFEPDAELGVWKRLADIAQSSGNKLIAGRALVQAVRISPQEEKALLASMASGLLRNIDRSEWFRLSEIAFQLEPQNEKYILDRVLTLTNARQYDEADELLNSTADILQTNAAWLSAALQTQAFRGDYAKVLETWQKYPAIQKDINPKIIWTIAWALIQESDQEAANALVDRTLEQPIDLATRLMLFNVKGLGFRAAGLFVEALATYTRGLDLMTAEDKESDLLTVAYELVIFNRGLVLQNLGRNREAVNDIKIAIELLNRNGDPAQLPLRQAGLAVSIFHEMQFEQAEWLLLEARELLKDTSDWRTLRSIELQLSYQYMEWKPPLGEILSIKYARGALRYLRLLGGLPEVARDLVSIAWAEAVFGDPTVALDLIEEQLLLAHKINSRLDMARGNWIRARTRFALGFIAESKTEMSQSLEILREFEPDVTFERFGLEFDWMFGLETSAAERIKRLEKIGDEAALVLYVAKRYFPQLFDTPRELPTASSQKLEVLGEMRFAGEAISKRLRKAREFLALLLEARLTGRAALTQLEIVDALYPNEDEEKASTSVRQLIYRLRKNFGENIVQHNSNGYVLGVSSDAEGFLQTLDTTLWRGAYLAQTMKLSPNVTEALYHALARATQESMPSHPNEAARVSRILLAANPYNLESLRLCIQALSAVQAEDLAAVYKTNRELFVGIGEVLPETWEEWLQLEG